MSTLNPAVIVGLSGGLGNQMFQYAAGRALSLRLDLPLVLDLSWFAGRDDRTYALGPFNIQASLAGQTLQVTAPGSLRDLLRRLSRRFLPRKMGAWVYRERSFTFDAEVAKLKHPVYLDGYWQSEKYFADHGARIAADFSIREALSAPAQTMLTAIENTDAICIHIRRGDYVSNPVATATHGLCSLDYYRRGVQQHAQGMGAPHCYIFSDDPLWVKQNLQLDVPFTLVEINGTDQAHIDLILMAACKKFVIANSSLSWWGAWLCQRPGKQVIAPQQWFADGSRDARDLIPTEWVRL